MTATTARTTGIHHAGLTVPDIEATAAFFEQALGFRRVGGNPAYPSLFLSDGIVLMSLWQAADPSHAVPFDRRKNIGLHHLALRLADPSVLDGLHAELAVERTPSSSSRPSSSAMARRGT